MTRRELLLDSFDDHIITLRVLSRRFTGADRLKDLPTVMNPDWRSTRNWYDALWLFELQGIKASKYHGVLENGAAAEYATPGNFARHAAAVMFRAPDRNRTIWHLRWRALPTAEVELDPRYVAFRTMHDWVIVNAKVLAERGDAFDDHELEHGFVDWEPTQRVDPSTCVLPPDAGSDDVPIALSCGNPREQLVGGPSRNPWDADFVRPEWHDVKRPWAAIQYFHSVGLFLPERLRYGALREPDDPRLTQLELLRPDFFASYVAGVIAKDDVELSRAWRDRPFEDVRNDPRFMAHKCGFDTQIILHIARGAMKVREAEIEGTGAELGLGDSARLRAVEDGEALYQQLMELGPETTDSEVDDKPEKPN